MNPLNGLTEYLERIERRLRMLAVSRGAAWTAGAALAFTVLGVLIANYFAFSPPSVFGARLVLFLALAGAFAVGLIVVFTGIRVTRDTTLQLMDTMPDRESMAHVRNAALTVPGVRGVEKCYARKTGLQYHVDLHLEVDPEITVRQSHEIATQVRIVIRETLPWVADVLVHVEPAP